MIKTNEIYYTACLVNKGISVHEFVRDRIK